MKFNVLSIRSREEGFARLAKLRDATKGIHGEHIVLNFSGCGFFDANMAAALKVVLSRIEDEENTVELVNIPQAVEIILRKNNFLCDYGLGKIHDANQTTLPFRKFGLADLHMFAAYLDEHLSGKGIPKMTPELERRFRQSIFEIFQNCVMHSRLAMVFSCVVNFSLNLII